MEHFLSQLPTLVGVVVGAAASYLATIFREKTQWTRTQQARWVDERVDVYAAYGNAVKRVYELSKRLAASRGLPTAAAAVPLDTGLDELSQASIARSEVWEKLLLVGDPETVAAARAWHRSVWDMEAFALGKYDQALEWTEAVRTANGLRSRFYEIARRDLGITSGPLPQPMQEIL